MSELKRAEEQRCGTCCDCGYSGDDETPCEKREDGTHCEHWWEGPDEEAKRGA